MSSGIQTQSTSAAESRVFCRYLSAMPANDYISHKYAAYHARPEARSMAPRSAFDRRLLDCVRCCSCLLPFIDAYTAHFFRDSVVRRKLILMLALLECTHPYCEAVDHVDGGGRIGVWTRLILRGLFYGGRLMIGLVLLAPFHIASLLLEGRAKRKAI